VEYLARYSEVDVMLDTFPYPGGTTTCEALWMGVPTLTLAGDTLMARVGASMLTAVRLEEWIATSVTDYVDKAVKLAGDLPKLAALRSGLRERALASPVFDAPRFARNLEAALWGMWQARTQLNSPTPQELLTTSLD
jgi:predicted O-linked N-acetylglucosamine transferase (SPINDLY family)